MVYSIQQMRAVAAFLVVVIHVASVLRFSEARLFYPDMDEVDMAFTFSAGFLFQAFSLNKPYLPFIKRRARNVLIPYVVFSIPALLIYTVLGKAHATVDLSAIPQALLPFYLLLSGVHLGPYWFIPMLFTLYLATPLFRHLDRSGLFYALFIGIGLVLASTVIPRPGAGMTFPQAAAHYAPVFALGMACSRYNDWIERLARKIWVWLPAAVLFFALSYLTSIVPPDHHHPIKVAMLICMFIVFTRTANLRLPLVETMSQYAFGIFFLHAYFVAVLRALRDRGTFDLAYTTENTVLISAVICVLCIVTIQVLKRLVGRHSELLFRM